MLVWESAEAEKGGKAGRLLSGEMPLNSHPGLHHHLTLLLPRLAVLPKLPRLRLQSAQTALSVTVGFGVGTKDLPAWVTAVPPGPRPALGARGLLSSTLLFPSLLGTVLPGRVLANEC